MMGEAEALLDKWTKVVNMESLAASSPGTLLMFTGEGFSIAISASSS
jgi:hypothetical protein